MFVHFLQWEGEAKTMFTYTDLIFSHENTPRKINFLSKQKMVCSNSTNSSNLEHGGFPHTPHYIAIACLTTCNCVYPVQSVNSWGAF